MKVSARGLEFIEAEEGFRSEPYNDSRGHATQGIGHLLHLGPVTDADRAAGLWTREQARQQLARDLWPIEDWLDRLLGAMRCPEDRDAVLRRSYRIDALASWALNVGLTKAMDSTLARCVVEQRPLWAELVAVELMRWCSPGKPDSAALLNRRRREAYLWLCGHDGVPR